MRAYNDLWPLSGKIIKLVPLISSCFGHRTVQIVAAPRSGATFFFLQTWIIIEIFLLPRLRCNQNVTTYLSVNEGPPPSSYRRSSSCAAKLAALLSSISTHVLLLYTYYCYLLVTLLIFFTYCLQPPLAALRRWNKQQHTVPHFRARGSFRPSSGTQQQLFCLLLPTDHHLQQAAAGLFLFHTKAPRSGANIVG